MGAKKPILTCPYTGEPFEIIATADGYEVRGGYDPVGWARDPAEIERRLRFRDGVPEAHAGPLVCPYTGRAITVVERGLSQHFRAQGAWTPRGKVWTWRTQLVYDISYRNGEAPEFEREPPTISLTDREAPQSSDPSEDWGARNRSDIVDKVVEHMTSDRLGDSQE